MTNKQSVETSTEKFFVGYARNMNLNETEDKTLNSNKELFVLSHYRSNGHLIGIFSTQEKAKNAAIAYMNFFHPGKKITISEGDTEIFFSTNSPNTTNETINIAKWVIDKALQSDGKWGSM